VAFEGVLRQHQGLRTWKVLEGYCTMSLGVFMDRIVQIPFSGSKVDTGLIQILRLESYRAYHQHEWIDFKPSIITTLEF
jgi:hypothetical protein